MIETAHGRDDRRRVPVYSLYSEAREPSAEMLREVDVLVIDLQDVGTRIYTYIYTMANCLIAARKHGVKVDRVRPAQPDRRHRGRGADADPGLRVVRRPLSHSDATRHDDRRARAIVQRALRHRRRPRSGRAGPMAARHVPRHRAGAVGHALAQHSDARHRDRVSRHRPVRGNECLRRSGNHTAVRARRRAGRGGGALCRRAESPPPAGCLLPAGGVRADIPQACAPELRRLPDSRARSRGVPPRADRRGADRRLSRGRSRAASAGAIRRTSTSTRSCRSTSLRGRRRCVSRSRRELRRKRSHDRGNRLCTTSRRCAGSTLLY